MRSRAAVLKPAIITARDVKLMTASATATRDALFLQTSIPYIDTMDEEDQFGIPSDYYSNYSEAAPGNYSENFPTSSFDEFLDEPLADRPFEDYGKYMRVIFDCFKFILSYAVIVPYNSSPELFLGGQSEPGIGLHNPGASGHRGLGLTPSGLSIHPSPEYGQYAARHDQGFQCMQLNHAQVSPH